MATNKVFYRILKKTVMLIAVLTFMFTLLALANNVFAVDEVLDNNIEKYEIEEVISEKALADLNDAFDELETIIIDINNKVTSKYDFKADRKEDFVSFLETIINADNEEIFEVKEDAQEDQPEEVVLETYAAENEYKQEEVKVSQKVKVASKAVKAEPKAEVRAVSEESGIEQAEVTIKYVDKDTNKVIETKTIKGMVGSTLSVHAEKIKGYKAEIEVKNIEVTKDLNVITFLCNAVEEEETTEPVKEENKEEPTTEYIKKGVETTVKVNYVDSNGRTILKSKEIKSISGNVLTAFAEEIEGYSVTKQKESVTVKESGSSITFVYDKVENDNIKSENIIVPNENELPENPKTGDNDIAIVCAILLVLSLGVAIVCGKKYKGLMAD